MSEAKPRGPSFAGLVPASSSSSRAKQANRKRDTKPELLLRHTLWRMGLRYNTCVTSLPGSPDIVFPRLKLAVFCDGDFWHGRNWPVLHAKLQEGANRQYWVAKIARNRERDAEVDQALQQLGWRVLRLWETDIRKDPRTAAECVANLCTH